MSGRRDSNPLPTAWEAVALPGELLPLFLMQYKKLSAGVIYFYLISTTIL